MKNEAAIEHATRLVEEGSNVENDRDVVFWSEKTASFLRAAFGRQEAAEFKKLTNSDLWLEHAARLGYLQGTVARAGGLSDQRRAASDTVPNGPDGKAIETHDTKKVFVVHGHDNAAKEEAARFLTRLDLQPIILHEQPSGGRTVIEKFEKYSDDVGFAVVLLTPDDVGGAKKDPSKLVPRARQNVVLELGYFMGKLTRDRVCALYKPGVELPSDIQGVVYVEMDKSGAWKAKLAQEFVQAKLSIRIEGLLG